MKKLKNILLLVFITTLFMTSTVSAEEIKTNINLSNIKVSLLDIFTEDTSAFSQAVLKNEIENNEDRKYFIHNGEEIKLNLRKDLISKNYKKNDTIVPEYIVIHETDNWNVGANAAAHQNWWDNDPYARSSVHFVVDDKETIQLLELDKHAFHVGDNRGFSNIENYNSIGIEICVNQDGNYEVARKRAILLTKYLIKELNLDSSTVVRHKDASNKDCPATMIKYPELWDDFVTRVDTTFPDEDYFLQTTNQLDLKYAVAYMNFETQPLLKPLKAINTTQFKIKKTIS